MQKQHWFTWFVLSLLVMTMPGTPVAGREAPAAAAPALLQFTAGGHVIGFAPTQVILAAFDHALRVEFVGTAGVTPVASGAEAASPHDGLTMGRAQPLGAVTYPDLWRGVSVEYRASEAGILKSTYTLAPGADVAQIRLRYNVPVELQSDGSLQFRFGRGVIIESTPLAWQEIDGKRVSVPVAFALPSPVRRGAGGEVAFRLGAYDPRYPLTIDPNYVWHTFYGSADDDDVGYGIAVDGSGNVYITGESDITWQGPSGESPKHAHSGGWDIVVVKLNSNGAYQWHTFYGSSSYGDAGYGITVDGDNVYITGESAATWQGPGGELPKHAHSSGINYDIVVVKLSSNGEYQWHTFYGSANWDHGYGIAVGGGNVYITGYSYNTWQGDGGANPLHAHSSGINDDIVVMKLTSAGAYQWHTFYGGSGWDYGEDIAVDDDNVYVTGESDATWQGGSDLNPIDPLHAHSGGWDIVALKLNSDGAYQWHTFYGASSDDAGYGIAVYGSGNVYIAGFSWDPWQGDGEANPLHAHSGNCDIVVVKLNSNGAYQWHTFYGSASTDGGYGIAVDGSGNLYITGDSRDPWGAPLHAHSGGYTDIVALKLNSAGEYQWHTFYGGSSWDYGEDIAVDGDSVYVTGESRATWQGDGGANPRHAYSGEDDIVALKLLGTPTQLHRLYLPLILKGY